MLVVRTADTDDDGTGTTGTIRNNAWKTAIYDAMDGAFAAAGICEGRLTLTTALPVTTADVTGATSLYWTPYKGKYIALYNGSTAWIRRLFVDTALALGTLVNAQGYDVFGYDNAGTFALESAEWKNATITMTIAAPGVVTWTTHGMATGNSITFTNAGGALPTGVTANTQYWITVVDANSFKLSTSLANVAAATFITTSGTQSGVHTGHQPQARQTALVLQDGVYVKTGATTRRYLGSFLATSTTGTEDSYVLRNLWNYYNYVPKPVRRRETNSVWTYNTATIRQARASALNQIGIFQGLAERPIDLSVLVTVTQDTAASIAVTGIGEDSTNTISVNAAGGLGIVPLANIYSMVTSRLVTVPTIGLHVFTWLEKGAAVGGSLLWFGVSTVGEAPTGLEGVWEC